MSIAIDGPAGSGKSTLAAGLARRLGLRHIDTGSMYRAAALMALEAGVELHDAQELSELIQKTPIELAGGDKIIAGGKDVTHKLRSTDVTAAASRVAQIPEVRQILVSRQRKMAEEDPEGVVMEGRDIGTVVLPQAALKIFLTADLQERANRRAKQAGSDAQDTMLGVAVRDRRDIQRQASPLAAAADAVVLDTGKLTASQVLDQVIEMVNGLGTAERREGAE